jgi:hypothetical protein
MVQSNKLASLVPDELASTAVGGFVTRFVALVQAVQPTALLRRFRLIRLGITLVRLRPSRRSTEYRI